MFYIRLSLKLEQKKKIIDLSASEPELNKLPVNKNGILTNNKKLALDFKLRFRGLSNKITVPYLFILIDLDYRI